MTWKEGALGVLVVVIGVIIAGVVMALGGNVMTAMKQEAEA